MSSAAAAAATTGAAAASGAGSRDTELRRERAARPGPTPRLWRLGKEIVSTGAGLTVGCSLGLGGALSSSSSSKVSCMEPRVAPAGLRCTLPPEAKGVLSIPKPDHKNSSLFCRFLARKNPRILLGPSHTFSPLISC